jgi:hypothetical protein
VITSGVSREELDRANPVHQSFLPGHREKQILTDDRVFRDLARFFRKFWGGALPPEKSWLRYWAEVHRV